MKSILTQLRIELDGMANEAAKASAKKFFKEELTTRGIKVPLVRKLAGEYRKQLKDLSKSDLFRLCEDLWQSGYFEESIIACDWSYSRRKDYEPSDFAIFERWVKKYVNNWASCDTLCNHTVGEFLQKYPDHVQQLKKWAVSKNRWMKRAAAVSLIIPARKGVFLEDILEIASIQLTDADDMVQKGYGWMLKAASEANLNKVFRFVIEHKGEMPRTALRYAIEKMPADKKAKAMAK
ncbi:MAG TPA: DNA alkylation repair protein [Pseudobacter sp.]|nr:DNA alkylation repair protein [Pseudobacter sp.]